MSNLRNKVIKLANAKPELRKHLLPLIVDSAIHGKKQSKQANLGKLFKNMVRDPSDDYYRSEASDFAMNVFRDWAAENGLDRQQQMAFLLSELRFIQSKKWEATWEDFKQYVRSRNPNREYRIPRSVRMAIYIQLLSKKKIPYFYVEDIDRDGDPKNKSNPNRKRLWAKEASVDAGMFDKLRTGQRIVLDYSSGFHSGEREFEVGRRSFSRKYNVHSIRLYPVLPNGDVRKKGMKIVLFKREGGQVTFSVGGMGAMIKNFFWK